MKKIILPLIAAGILVGSITGQASILINLSFAGRLQDQAGTTLANGSLLQLVDLGANGVFDVINVGDGSAGAGTVGQWTSGDDVLLHTALLDIGTDFNFASAFDLVNGAEPGTGIMGRSFTIDAAHSSKIGLRWWPSLTASNVQTNFGTFNLAAGTRFGEFTRNAGGEGGGTALYGDQLWIGPGDGNFITFDSFGTIDAGGVDANILGRATETVLNVPEPTSGLLAVAGAGLFGAFRRRRRQA